MTVKFEIKDQLARLLATEDLIVEHKKVETASFNVNSGVLILPMWDKASNNVYDLLVGHDAGSSVAGVLAMIRPDIFRSVVMMSAPYTGAPDIKTDLFIEDPIHHNL